MTGAGIVTAPTGNEIQILGIENLFDTYLFTLFLDLIFSNQNVSMNRFSIIKHSTSKMDLNSTLSGCDFSSSHLREYCGNVSHGGTS